MTVCEIDCRPEGSWYFVWHTTDGTKVDMGGVYREVAPPGRLVYTECWGGDWPEAVTTLSFSEEHGRTTISLKYAYPSCEARDRALESGMKDGMEFSFDRLERYTTALD
jgi:uncharacterized protein YndB with AHSA1/START domain